MKLLANNRMAKTLAGCLATSVLLLAAFDASAAISQSPLSLTVGVPPNMLLTLDDSGSMRWAFAPDGKSGTGATRRAKSSVFNPLYYDPSVKYSAPIVFDTSGAEQQLSTSYTSALVNGYNTARGTLDLSTNYKVTWTYVLESGLPTTYGYNNTSNRLAENPLSDFTCSVTDLSTNGSYKACTLGAGKTVTITRGANSGRWNNIPTCKATADGWPDGNCSYSNNSYTASWTQKGVPAYYYTFNANIENCSKDDDSCYTLNFVNPTEQQNFANWFSFYRNRALATISAAALAFHDLSPSVRLSWQGLGRCTSFTGSDSNCKNNAFRDYSPEHKGQLYAWLQDINFDQSTYLPAAMKRAGEFLKTDTPWQKSPNGTGNSSANTYACRSSYHIMMTDGLWNQSVSAPANFRHDGTSSSLPDGQHTYNNQRPYYDSQENSLADLAMHYWATDLNPNLGNKLPAYVPYKSGNDANDYWDPRNDPATWQHMTSFMMGLGLTEALNKENIPWEGSTHTGAGYQALITGAATWPAASASGGDNNVYDLWHSAINSRGEFFSVDSPNAMVQAFSDILSRIADRKSSAAKPAINSGQITQDEQVEGRVVTVSYQSSYASDENWSGDLKRTEKGWNTENNQYETKVKWSAEEEVPEASNRGIYIASNSAQSGLQTFITANAGLTETTGSLAYHLNKDPENGNATDGNWQSRLSYLRGDRSLEGTSMRKRSSILGDFYASSPVSVAGPRYLVQFADRLEGRHGADTYTSFVNSISARTPRVYIGGNDGMLHGFNANTGAEEFAFIPTSVFPKLNKLTGRNYTHEFYVDGTPVVADAFDGNQWRTILVGTLRAGGKSIFALDITQPGEEKLLWEFDDSDITEENAVKMGYSFSQPTVARLDDGKWYAVFGNGYQAEGSNDGRAALFIVDVFTGELKETLEVSGTANVPNGLSTPKLSDYTNDGIAEYAYAGDLQGNLWRFDLPRSMTADNGAVIVSNSKVGYGAKPMFQAVSGSTRQPITSPPSLVQHPTGIGYLVIFGTGKYFEDSDKDGDKTIAQSVYGIWDRQTRGESTSAIDISRSELLGQSIQTTTTTDGTTARVISSDNVAWMATDSEGQATVNKWGWYLDLKSGALEGEMVIEPMLTLGRTLFFQSLIPNSDPCSDGANNWTYAINPHTGGRTAQNAFGLTPVTFNDKTTAVSAIRQDGEGGLSAAQNPDQSFELCTGVVCAPVFPDPSSIGRQTWRAVTAQ